jgi:hypothetical protein
VRRQECLWRWLLSGVLVAALLLGLPRLALADGGPVLSDPQLWAMLKEGQQIGVVTLGKDDALHVDLFISMLDQSGESHEITYFLPLGQQSSAFEVKERTSLDFDQSFTQSLDTTLKVEALRLTTYRNGVRWSLLLGTLLLNGGWSWPLWLVWSLASCAPMGGVAPIATFETPSSQVAIYDLDPNTDLTALIQTTGLDPVVRDTLARFQGQQIAVVKLRTQPAPEGTGGTTYAPAGQPGLHLAWTSRLVPGPDGLAYSYPLGTGSAWAQPIEQTRIYVVAPPGVDFRIEYPRLGADLSGYSAGGWFGRSAPRIQGAGGAAFAVEDAIGVWGRVWRVTYMQSNSTADVSIVHLSSPSPQTLRALARAGRQSTIQLITWPLSFVVAALLWVVVWRLVMARLLGVRRRWLDWRGHLEALAWSFLYPFTNGIVFAAVSFLAVVTAGISILIGIPVLIATLLGALSMALFVRHYTRKLGVSRGRALLAYLLVVALANAVYLAFALGYAAVVGVL